MLLQLKYYCCKSRMSASLLSSFLPQQIIFSCQKTFPSVAIEVVNLSSNKSKEYCNVPTTCYTSYKKTECIVLLPKIIVVFSVLSVKKAKQVMKLRCANFQNTIELATT